ncbi:hypothetical protein MLD38_035356 [Melastoma candidum]|uniref:Uncharacterized protein n=1 Tax=Melastoma candidum TaxID=119954 RepID=A0ACB9LGF8_9MYRT|nr:hypothetical protein MLD38_035356 [Melastoma candidum]
MPTLSSTGGTLLHSSGLDSDKLSLPILQSKMKSDPEGYASELSLIYSQFNSSLDLFHQQAALSFSSISGVSPDPSVAKDLGDRAMFLAHVAPFYPQQLADFPNRLADFLKSSARGLPSGLRCHVSKALRLLINNKMVDMKEMLVLFMELQTLGDRALRELAFSHIVHNIKRINKKHKSEAVNRPLQNVLFTMLQQEDEAMAKRALVTLCELHRREVWFDDRTANAICTACFHPVSRIMIAALSFLLDYEKIIVDSDSDDSSDEEETSHKSPQFLLSKEAFYKANHKGTAASKKKKKAKLQRAVRSMKKKQRLSSANGTLNCYSPLNHLKDAQGFAEKLFSRLQTCNERFEVKMMMLKVVARTVGLHHLILLNLYPFLQKYVQPHQRDVTTLLAAAVQACHDMVPPDAVEPLFKQIVNQFIHDRSRPEAIAVGLNVAREICLRMPLLMTEDLLQDLVLYKKSHEKAVSAAARSLMSLFREICPSMLVKKDRGRPVDPKARPKAFGEVNVVGDVPGIELLQDTDDDSSRDDVDGDDGAIEGCCEIDESECCSSDGEQSDGESDSEIGNDSEDEIEMSDEEIEDCVDGSGLDGDSSANDTSESLTDDDEDGEDTEEITGDIFSQGSKDVPTDGKSVLKKKRKCADFDGPETSLRALKRLAGTKLSLPPSKPEDGILSNEDFKRIEERKAKKEAKMTLSRHGLVGKGTEVKSSFKVPNSDQLSLKRVDPAKLEAHVKKKLSKEERLELVRAGREDRGKYQARAAVKQKKTGGLSNRQKEHKKFMPIAAKRVKAARSREEKRRKRNRAGKQFRGKKAWK